jgi:hypothetical protein
MNTKNSLLLAMAILLLFSASLLAQSDKFGKVDTLYVEPYSIDGKNWGVNVLLVNDEDLIALQIPLTFSAGKNNRVVVDSTVFKGGRVEDFRFKLARVDTSTQCVTIGLINDLGGPIPPVPPGKGRLATIFVSSLDGKKIESLSVDTTTTPPSNDLQLVHPPTEGVVPAFIVLEPEKKKDKKK